MEMETVPVQQKPRNDPVCPWCTTPVFKTCSGVVSPDNEVYHTHCWHIKLSNERDKL